MTKYSVFNTPAWRNPETRITKPAHY